ncbi:uncharacterized protein MELLADRAFT_105331 [Melampsora larici-populina 98AG31]|uniref:Uncharacterized protein n=1 Tax=Melampsora larici-populina (strain 98AG31 / pathotype 3-4-7) TaxID=747676 RepID=F4RHS3_MELLP|nr:uncharacterized protein MELLADRAFT_105331 [Melampsora larici-populina 98AG31]EGG07875.1 hypothetical protein MELLADRAFT_105331 [Melampsora larici-populina 98AG31]
MQPGRAQAPSEPGQSDPPESVHAESDSSLAELLSSHATEAEEVPSEGDTSEGPLSEAEGMTLREFVLAVSPSASTIINHHLPPGRRLIVHRALNAISFMHTQNLTVYEFVLSLLDRCNLELLPHQRLFRGSGNYSRNVIRGVFIGLRNLIYAAGNQESIWRDLIQAEADDLSIYVWTG